MKRTVTSTTARLKLSCVASASRSRRSASPGFTLMETLLALSLCGMIVGSVATSIDLYWKYRTQSRDRVTSSHVLRGVLEDITGDLRAATVPIRVRSSDAPELPDNVQVAIESGALPPTAESSLRIQEQFLNLQANQMGTPINFVGTRSAIAILTDHGSHRFANTRAAYGTSRRQHLVWWANEGQSVRLQLSQIGSRQIQSTIEANDLPSGLVRATEPFGINDNSSGAKSPLLISKLVTSIRFRYFDGAEWHVEWDSSKQMCIPTAVEISLLLKDQPEKLNTFIVSIPHGG